MCASSDLYERPERRLPRPNRPRVATWHLPAAARLDEWARELAPSDELRRSFAHDPARFDEFRARYGGGLVDQHDRLLELARRARSRPVTIVYAASDQQHNNAVVVADLV